ncbi:unnamed protein product [Closterium sp. NIES-54]
MWHWCHEAFARVGLDPTSLGTHSFRKTAATLAADAGVPDRLFKALGRWRSDCAKEMYITQLNSELIRASRLMQDPTRLSSTIRYAATVNRRPHHLPCGPRAALPGPDPPPSGLVAHPCGIALPYGPTAALTCGPATLTCGPRRPYLRTPPPLPAASPPLHAAPPPSPAASPPLPAAPSPVRAALPPLPAAPPPLPAAKPPSPAASPHLPADPAALNCGLAAPPYLRPRRPYLRPRRPLPVAPSPSPAAPSPSPPLTCGPVALTCGPATLTCGPTALTCGLAAPHLRPCRPYLRPHRPPLAALPPFPSAPSLAAAPRTTRAARETEPPHGPAGEPPSSRAAQQPSRPAAEPPSRPATEQPSHPAAEPPCSRAAEPPYLRASTVVMATPSVLAFDAEGRAIDFDVWVDDLQLFLQCDRADGLSLFDLTSGASPAPAADADATVRSQWATCDAAARLAVRRHLPPSERAHFSQYKSAQTLYDAVVARYSSPATAALSRLLLPYLFPDLAAFSTVADLITHLRTSDTRYRAALPADFCAKNPPPQSAEQSIVAVGASRGDPRTPIFEGCSPSPLLPSVASVTTADLSGLESVGAASASNSDAALARAKGAGALEARAGAVEVEVEAAGGVGVAVGVEVGVEVSVAAVEAEAVAAVAVGAEVAEAAVEEPAEAAVVAEAAEVAEAVGVAVELVAGLRRGVAPVVRGGGFGPCTYVLRTGNRAGEQCGGAHPTQRCFGHLTDAWRCQFPEATEIPRWGELSRAGVAIYDLDFDAILSAMYAMSISDEGDCYRCFPPDPGIGEAAVKKQEWMN